MKSYADTLDERDAALLKVRQLETVSGKALDERDAALLKIKQLESVANVFKWGTLALGIGIGALLCRTFS